MNLEKKDQFKVNKILYNLKVDFRLDSSDVRS